MDHTASTQQAATAPSDGDVAALLDELAVSPGSNLIGLLQQVQDRFGYLPEAALAGISRRARIPLSRIYGVVTFYAQFYLSPQGKHKIKVCQGTACHVRGGRSIMDAVRRKLSIEPGGTTEDLMFSLERVACFGSCALAPVVVVDGKAYGRMTPEKASKLLETLK